MVDAPAWFRRALAVPFTDEHVEVGGARIHYLAWGEHGRPRARVRPRRRRARALVDPPGGHASPTTSAWSRSTCPATATATTATSTRSSSGPRRSSPSPTRRASPGHPVVIGHSMGGFVTIATAALHADRLTRRDRVRLTGDRAGPRGRVVPAEGRPSARPARTPRSTRRVARFRTVPPQDRYLDLRDGPRGRALAEAGRGRVPVEVRPRASSSSSPAACGASPGPTCQRSAAGSRCCARRTVW